MAGLRLIQAIRVGGIDQPDPGVEGGVDHADRFVLGGAFGQREVHRSEPDHRDGGSGGTERNGAHRERADEKGEDCSGLGPRGYRPTAFRTSARTSSRTS